MSIVKSTGHWGLAITIALVSVCCETNALFGLVSPRYGCPYLPHTTWGTARREIHFNEGRLSWTVDIHLLGNLDEKNIQWDTCIFEPQSEDANGGFLWEPGNYCVLRASDSCPDGLESDGAMLSTLGNASVEQVSGVYRNLEEASFLPLCCSRPRPTQDLTHMEALTFPFTSPFYLIKYDQTLPCPFVNGYVSQEEHVRFSSDDGEFVINLCFYMMLNKSEVRLSSNCPDGWLYNGGYCYYFSNYSLPWFDGQADCQSKQANLVSITNEQEQSFLAREMYRRISQFVQYYIGLNDVDRENVWAWADKVPTDESYINWHHNEPNDAVKKEDCIFYRIDTENWNDIDCGQEEPFICKRVAAPASIPLRYLGRVTPSSVADGSSPKFATDDTTETCFQSRWESEQWLQIDLGHLHVVSAVLLITEKRLHSAGIYIGMTSEDFLFNGSIVCAENFNTQDVTTLLHCHNPLRGRFITISQGHLPGGGSNTLKLCDIRVYAQASSCGVPLGVSTGEVSSLQLTASSSQPPHWAHLGRLNSAAPWCPLVTDTSPFLQVTLAKPHIIQAIEVGGRNDDGWVTSFSIYTGMTDNSLEPVKSTSNHIKIFKNTRQLTTIHPLPDDVMAQVVRLSVQEYSGHPCVAVELHGCNMDTDISTDSRVCPMSLGRPPLPQPRQSTGQLLLLVSFPCAGRITSIDYYATSSDTFTLHTWKLINNIAIGPTDQISISPDDSVGLKTVADVDIPVLEGYMLGVHSSGVLPIPYGVQDDIGVLASDLERVFAFDISILTNDSQMSVDVREALQLKAYFSISVVVASEKTTYDESCGGYVTSPGSITSPNFPYYYGQRKKCTWTILPPAGRFPALTFTHFDLQGKDASGCADILSLYDAKGDTPRLLYEGSGHEFPLVLLDSDRILLELTSCTRLDPQAATGFSATVKFEVCAGCGVGSMESSLSCTHPCGYLATPNYPHLYPNNFHRSWHISVAEGQYIRLELQVSGVESTRPVCNQDYLELFDFDFAGNRKSTGIFCNAQPTPPALFSSWHQMALEFLSDKDISGTGFLATYSSVRFTIPVSLLDKINLQGGDCPSSWVEYAENCYHLTVLTQGTSWLDAEDRCQQDQANLVSIMDKHEMQVLHYLLTTAWAAKETTTYIGLTDSQKEGQFRWSDSRPMIFTSWANQSTGAPPQPDGGELEGCSVIQLANLYSLNQWHDVPCSLNSVKQFVCKKHLLRESHVVEVPQPYSNSTYTGVSLYQCHTGEYIRDMFVCDGQPHCRNGSDEYNCVVCEEYQFSCGDDQCVHISKYCDFHQDCKNGADESHCVMPECKTGEFQCDNKQCIPDRQRCNIIVDCADGSDEENCDTCQRPDTFQCYDGRCLPWHTRCDRVKDCSGCTNEDEQGCFDSPLSLCSDIIKCDQRPLEGFGILTFTHDLTPNKWAHGSRPLSLSVAYIGLATDDELQAAMERSYKCEQQLLFNCESAINTTSWESLTSGATWYPTEVAATCSSEEGCIVEVSDKAALPVKLISVNDTCQSGSTHPLDLGPLLCYTDVGAREVNSVLKCENGQKIDSKWRCLFEFDEFGVQKGCRDMSHIQGCGQLKTQYTECKKSELAPDYVGTKSYTASNRTCQRWDMQTPHRHPYFEPEFFGVEDISDVHNFCRNPDKGLPPFCFTMDPERWLEPCDIPICGNDTGETWVFECPENYVRCPGDYCIPLHYVCDGQWHCLNGEDEQQCESYRCDGRFSCAGSDMCLPFHKLCDGIRNCDLGDDEEICHAQCPHECRCTSLVFNCSMSGIAQIPPDIYDLVKILDLSYNGIEEFDGEHQYYPFLGRLNLHNNKLNRLTPFQFKHMRNLMLLDLSQNDIQALPDKTFQNLVNLVDLNLEGNSKLSVIYPGAFEGLNSLTRLLIQDKALTYIEDSTFVGLTSLLELDLSDNLISHISDGAFQGLLALTHLILVGNDIKIISRQTFAELTSLNSLKSDIFKLCCLAEQVSRDNCQPPQDPISTCEDLMSTTLLRSFLWLLGIMALFGNIFVILWRLKFPNSSVPEVIINNLALSDLMMGLYMLIIAGVDYYYKGVFIEYSDQWRSSWLCKTAGFLGTFSSEGSVLFLCLLTTDRFINIMFPFGSFKLTRTGARWSAVGAWLIAFAASVIPLCPLDYFKDSFYGRSGVCLALPITSETPPGWEYSAAVFIGFNLVGFLTIAVGYSIMYVAINRSGAQAAGGLQRQQQIKLARNMMLIVATDFVCWLPIIIMGFAALNGATISGQVYAWVIVFVLPVNSAINPILYTFSSMDIRKELANRLSKSASSNEPSLVTGTTRIGHVSPLALSLIGEGNSQPLRAFCSSPKTTMSCVLHVLLQLVGLLKALHDSGMTHGQLNIKAVRICTTGMGLRVLATGADLVHIAEADSDLSEDIYHLGSLVREVLQAVMMKQKATSKKY